MEIRNKNKYYTRKMPSKDPSRAFYDLHVNGKCIVLLNNSKFEAVIIECVGCEAENSTQTHLRRNDAFELFTSAVAYNRADIVNTINMFWNDGDYKQVDVV